MTALPGVQRVVVAVDFGDASAAAVALAGDLAKAFGAQLTLLHAETLEMPPYFTSAQSDALEEDRRKARGATEYVRRFAALHTAVPVDVEIVAGPPAAAVLRRAPDFDLVVLGTHGRRGPRRWWLGSVADAVICRASVPAVTTRARESTPSERRTS
jgi:nucleotide-binding universal stress UspA family protein